MDKETILGIKDLDKHLAKYVEDKDVLNMIVNKRYLELFDEQFFHNLLILKYPLLIAFKKDETWKEFYIKMVYYMAKLKEEFNFPYFSTPIYDPISLYKHFQKNPDMLWNDGLSFAAQISDMKLIEEMIGKGGKLVYGLMGASMKGDRKLVDHFLQLGARGLGSALVRAAEFGHKDLVDYFISLGAHPKYAVIGAALKKDDDMFNYIVSKYPVNLNSALLTGSSSIIRYLIRKGANNLNQALISYGRRGDLKSVKILVSEGATNLEFARDDAMIHGKMNIVNYLDTLLD